MAGALTLAADPGTALGAATKQYVDARTPPVVLYVSQFPSIQAALDALPATGGRVVLSPNTTYVLTTGVVTTKPNVQLWAPGWSTIIRRAPTLTTGILVWLRGAGSMAEGITFDGNNVVATSSSELNVAAADCLVRRCQIINCRGTISLCLAGAGSRALYNTIIAPGVDLGLETGYGIWACNHDRVLIQGNTISGTGIDGIGADGEGTQILGNRVFGCHCYAAGSGGQIATYPTSGGGVGDHIVVAGNSVGPGGSGAAHGIECGAANMLVSGNSIDGVGGYGILVISGGTTITGNFLHNVGAPGIDGISIQPGVSDFVVSGNRISDDRATPQMRAGIYVGTGASDRYTIVGNIVTPNTLVGIVDHGAGQNKVIGFNTGYDNVIPTLASAATVSFPPNPVVRLTGAVAITAIDATFGAATGRTITIIPTGAASFVAGGNIANSVVAVSGVPITGMFDGTLWHFSVTGLPMSGGTLSGPLTATTLTASGGLIASAGAASNLINLSNHGLGAPTMTTRSLGTKLVLYDALSPSQTDSAIGAQGTGMWFGNTTGSTFSWYSGTSVTATLNQAGTMSITGAMLMANTLGVFNAASPPATRPVVSGAKGSNAALASLLTALASYGLVTDSTTA
jgi:hypothetical protein